VADQTVNYELPVAVDFPLRFRRRRKPEQKVEKPSEPPKASLRQRAVWLTLAKGEIRTEGPDRYRHASEKIFEMATSVVYQLSTGQCRTVNVTDCELYEAFSDLVDDDGGNFDEDSSIILQSAGYHRAVFINPNVVDYISIPTHLLAKSSDDIFAAILDELDEPDDDDQVESLQ